MTVSIELDADPPRLARSDGLTVRFLMEGAVYRTFEAGWLRTEVFEPLMRWGGLEYQELQPGTNAALLVGHVPGGGYCSAAVTLNEKGVTFEFADRIPVDAKGMQTIEMELEIRPRVDVEHAVFDGGLSFDDDVGDLDEFVRRRITIVRRASTKPLTHVHRLHLATAATPWRKAD